MFLSCVNGGKKWLAKQHSWPRVLGPYTRIHNHKLYPDQTLVWERNRLQSMVIMCKCEFTVHAHYQPRMTALAAATAHAHAHTHTRTHTHTLAVYLPFTDILVVGVFQNQLTYLKRRGFPILGRPLPALKPRNVCQQGVGRCTATPGDVCCKAYTYSIQLTWNVLSILGCMLAQCGSCIYTWYIGHSWHSYCILHSTSSRGDQQAQHKYNTVSWSI